MLRSGVQRVLALCWIALCGCGEVASDGESCEVDARLSDKRWFVGELDDPTDDPIFTATATLVVVEVDGDHQPSLSTEPQSHTARFQVTEDRLVSSANAGLHETLLAFAIISHRDDACHDPYDPSVPVDDELKDTLPWPVRPWMLVDWGRNVAVDGHRVDAASAAGFADFVEYEPVSVYEDAAHPLELALEEGWMAATVSLHVVWRDFDDGTPSCTLDFPTLPPSAECPPALVKIRWKLERS